ncbi:MAG TPA: dephospho-CoA kinase [Tepidisphaeraceae bacterium]|nr:dephospho-CoA kinase [Tepidisphaeraceae bacterium]
MYMRKPIIGIAGGIGSGKSFVARLFGELGCHVIDSDAQVRAAYRDPRVLETLSAWWGPAAVLQGQPNRAFISARVFSDEQERHRLEQLLHPIVNAARQREMQRMANDPGVLAFVWDTPLLFEASLAGACDVAVFVDSPEQLRIERLRGSRGWGPDEIKKRENSQWPLDRKRKLSDYVLSNAADAAQARDQVRELFPRILADLA